MDVSLANTKRSRQIAFVRRNGQKIIALAFSLALLILSSITPSRYLRKRET